MLPHLSSKKYMLWDQFCRELSKNINEKYTSFDVKDIFELTDYVLKNTEYRKPFPKINDVLCLRIWKTVDDFADFCKE